MKTYSKQNVNCKVAKIQIVKGMERRSDAVAGSISRLFRSIQIKIKDRQKL